MVLDDKLVQFISMIGGAEDSLCCAPDALAVIAGELDVAYVHMEFEVKPNAFTPYGETVNVTLYGSVNDCDGVAPMDHNFETGENGTCRLSFYHQKGTPNWSEETGRQIGYVAELLYVYLGRTRLINKVKQSVYTDFMTGLPNSTGYLQFSRELKEQGTLKDYDAFYFNLKGFSLINRMFGDQEANRIMVRYVRELQNFFSENEILARLGGDNFTAFVYKEKVQDFIKLLSGVKTYGELNNNQIPVVIVAVAGIVPIEDNEVNPNSVIELASIAINFAKNILKQPYVFLNNDMNEKVYREKLVCNQFQLAIDNEEFMVYYQPKVETSEYRVVGAEALVRWASDGSIIMPGDFVPILERNNTIGQLDFYVLERVCQDIRGWLDEGVIPVRTSVNFSRKNLLNKNFEANVVKMVRRYGIDPSYIEVEITETTDVEEQGRLNEFLLAMKAAHIVTAIDDFGTGYSSLNILRSFPVDILKIDKSFIDNGILSKKDSIVLANIVRMAKELDVQIITEGVETWQQVEFLKSIDCYMVQGFLFDKPLPKSIFSEKILQGRYDINEIVEIEQHNIEESKKEEQVLA